MIERTSTHATRETNPALPLVIVNPKSAAGATQTNWAGVASDLRVHFGPFQVAFTKRIGDGTILARQAAERGRRLIIACGGDGTVNEVANGILGSGNEDAEMGILPSGTGGDFRRTLGLSNEPREAARQLRRGGTRRIDVGRVTFLSHRGEELTRYFLNVASFGLSASINARVKTNTFFKWLPFGGMLRGRANFAYSTLQEVLEPQYRNVVVSLDDRPAAALRTLNFCVCNARFFGGGMKIAPEAKIDDGNFDIVNIGDIKTARILLNGYRLYNGSHTDLPEVKSTLAARVTVAPAEENETINIETDGELPGKLPATFEILPKALKFRIP